jgi:hypothetical protein
MHLEMYVITFDVKNPKMNTSNKLAFLSKRKILSAYTSQIWIICATSIDKIYGDENRYPIRDVFILSGPKKDS